MTTCNKCGSNELRVHGTRTHIEFRKKWWGLFGAILPHITAHRLEVSCCNCAFAFVVGENGVQDAPSQAVYEALQVAQARLNGAEAKPKDEGAPAPQRYARPAPDPRKPARR